MKSLEIIAFLFCTLISFSSFAEPISSKKLFSSPDYSMVKFSEDDKRVSSYNFDDKNKYLKFLGLEDGISDLVINVGNDSYLKAYEWLDSKHIYARVIYNNTNIIMIGELKGSKFSFTQIKEKGYLVDTLPSIKSKVLFAKAYRNSLPYYSLFIIDINDLKKNDFSNAKELEAYSKYTTNFTYNRKLKRILTTEFDQEKKIATVRFRTLNNKKWKTLLERHDTDYTFKTIDFIDEDTLAILTNKGTDKLVLRAFDIKSQKIGDIIFQHSSYDLEGASFFDNGQLNYVTFYQHGLVQRQYFNKGTAKILGRIVNTFKGQDFYFVDKMKNENTYILYVNGATQPGEYFLFDQEKLQLERLMEANRKLIDLKFSPTSQLQVKTKDGTELEAFLTLPSGQDLSTLLVMPHGGPIGIAETDRFNAQVQYYASRGFSVLRVNFRGSAGFGKNFQLSGVGEFGQLIEEDITSVVNQIKKNYSFKNICSIGASYGGYSAAMLAIKHPDDYQCVVGSFGVYDLPLLFNASNYRSGKEFEEWISKTVGSYSDNLKAVSPFYLFEQLKVPILLIAGKDDNTADFEHTNRFHYILKRKNHTVEKMFYENTGHGHSQWAGDRHEAAITYEFLMRILNLEYPQVTLLSEQAKEALAYDFVVIADGYSFNDNVENDPEKAFSFYQKSAEYDGPRANYNLGSFYYEGKKIAQDLKKSIAYFKRSAELGFTSGYYQLAKMYMDGLLVKQNWDKTFFYFKKAQKLDKDPQPKTNMLLARFYCTAPGNMRNMERCLSLLDLTQYTAFSHHRGKLAKREVRRALANIIAGPKLTTAEIKKLHDHMSVSFELTETEAFLEELQVGLFNYEERQKFNSGGKYVLTEQKGDESSAIHVLFDKNAKQRIGAIFEVDVPGFNSRGDGIALAVRWIIQTPSGYKKTYNEGILYGSPRGEWNFLQPVSLIDESATWTIEIYDLKQNLLLKRQFNVTIPDKPNDSMANH